MGSFSDNNAKQKVKVQKKSVCNILKSVKWVVVLVDAFLYLFFLSYLTWHLVAFLVWHMVSLITVIEGPL